MPPLTYPDAPEALILRWQKRRTKLDFGPGEGLPPRDADLATLARTPAAPPAPLPEKPSPHARKVAEVRAALAGHSELAVLNGVLIAHLRKRRWPGLAPFLFRRIWTEQAGALIAELPSRWLISSAITFADHGATEAERRLGAEINVLFSLMKLYEFERLQAGLDPAQKRAKRPHPGPLPLGMEPFSLATGGLDINLLAPIWARAEGEAVVGPLVCALLDRLNRDGGNLFRRLDAIRRARRARKAAADPAT